MLLALALGGLASLLPWALASIAAEYILAVVIHGRPFAATVLYGAGLLILGELGYSSLGFRAVDLVEPSVVRRRLALLGLAGLGAAILAALAAGAARVSFAGGVPGAAIGVAAAAGSLAAIATLARRGRL